VFSVPEVEAVAELIPLSYWFIIAETGKKQVLLTLPDDALMP